MYKRVCRRSNSTQLSQCEYVAIGWPIFSAESVGIHLFPIVHTIFFFLHHHLYLRRQSRLKRSNDEIVVEVDRGCSGDCYEFAFSAIGLDWIGRWRSYITRRYSFAKRKCTTFEVNSSDMTNYMNVIYWVYLYTVRILCVYQRCVPKNGLPSIHTSKNGSKKRRPTRGIIRISHRHQCHRVLKNLYKNIPNMLIVFIKWNEQSICNVGAICWVPMIHFHICICCRWQICLVHSVRLVAWMPCQCHQSQAQCRKTARLQHPHQSIHQRKYLAQAGVVCKQLS